jgi:hypothetical protein
MNGIGWPNPLSTHRWVWRGGIVGAACSYHLGTGGVKSFSCPLGVPA